MLKRLLISLIIILFVFMEWATIKEAFIVVLSMLVVYGIIFLIVHNNSSR